MASEADGDADADAEVLFREITRRFLFLTLVTEVRSDGVYVRLGPVERSFRTLSPAEIRSVEVASYAATDYGGWHWGRRRTADGDVVYRLRGGRGVELGLEDGSRWFVGSQREAQLKAAVEDASDATA